jgi:2,3-bisphosphoglycerate-independent phosphoglycerate mutase
LPDGSGDRLVALVVLDGWGLAAPGPGNAVELAETPIFDALWERFPHTTLKASGQAVGLPDGQMGNSEVGHLTIGSGRILSQDFERVNAAISDGSLFENDALRGAFRRARRRGGDVHLLGLVSDGGVHSHIDHLRALLDVAQQERMEDRTWIDAFTDGRDVSPHAAVDDLASLPAERVATVVGRYYAMDRDQRWQRTERAVEAICSGAGRSADDPAAAVRESYGAGVTDEFVEPIVLDGRPHLRPDVDGAIFFNFRPDRARQLAQRLVERGVDLTTMTHYSNELDCPVVFGEQVVPDTLADVLSAHGVRQLHAAETEKYAHVTYFFNGGEEEERAGETRILVPSPRDVPSYDLKPEMAAEALTDEVVGAIGDKYGFCVVNLANPDMVGHTGVIPAAVRALEVVDSCLGRIVDAVAELGGACLVTADHGNAEQLLTPDGSGPHTAHTTNRVPLVLTSEGASLRENGGLADLAPTVLDLLGIPVPEAMTGQSLVTTRTNGHR